MRKAALVLCSVADDERVARERLRRMLAFILRGQHHARNLELTGTRLDQAALGDAFGHEDWDMVDALVTDDVLRRHTASGAPREVKAMLTSYRDAGLDEIVIYGMRDSKRMLTCSP